MEAIPLKLPVTTILEVKEGEVTCHPKESINGERASRRSGERAGLKKMCLRANNH